MKNNHRQVTRRVIALLTREEMEFLDKVGMDSLFSTGSKLSRVEMISALVNAALALGISGEGVRNKDEMIQKIIDTAHLQPDRRRYPRLKKNLIINFRRIESMEQYERGDTNDIGRGGFSADVAFLGKPFAVNQTVEVNIRDPQGKAEPIKAIGRIAWVREKGNGHSHEIGIMLTYIKEDNKEQFLEYLTEEIDEKTDLE